MGLRDAGIALLAVLASGCGGPPAVISGCEPVGDLVPVCGLDKPEDIELLPDGRTLLISQLGALETNGPGSLVLYDTVDGAISPLTAATNGSDESWGAGNCPGPAGESLSPHGIDLAQREDGRLQLLVVNHGNGERVEFFEIEPGDRGYRARWRGCVPAPAGNMLNDVVALPGGGFLATNMFDQDSPRFGPLSLATLKGMLGLNTGYVIRWNGREFDRLEGTDAPLPNGIQLAPDGRHLYLNAYFAGEVRKISYPEGHLVGRAAVSGPDNSQWDQQGRLLVASQSSPRRGMPGCFKVEQGPCGAAFEIVALDPDTMVAETLLSHAGAPMGAATVAQQVGEYLYIGSFVGDRMLRAPLDN